MTSKECECGRVLPGPRRVRCDVCIRDARIEALNKEISRTEERVSDQKRMVDFIISQRDRLAGEIKSLKSPKKKKWDFSFTIGAYEGQCDEAYLKKVLDAAKTVPHCVVVQYRRNP